MKESRFSEQQIVGILKEAEVGVVVKELCRKHGISDAPFYSSPPSLSPGASAAALSFATYPTRQDPSECVHRALQSQLPRRGPKRLRIL